MSRSEDRVQQAFMTKVLFAVLGVVLAGLTTWVASINASQHDITALTAKQDRILADLEKATDKLEQVNLNTQAINTLVTASQRMAEWQEAWPRTGRLQEDVKQNAQLERLAADISRITARLDRIEDQRRTERR